MKTIALAFLVALSAVVRGQGLENMPDEIKYIESIRAADYGEAAVWVGMVGGAFTVTAAQQANPDNNLGPVAIALGAVTVMGIRALI